ncbi:MAG: acetylglutamate kinase [Verrucomicrobiales bacterium]
MKVPRHLKEHIGKAAGLVEALPYMQRFRGQVFLIKVGGASMEDPDLVEGLLRDVVFLEAVGINPVLVHGGGKAISRAMADEGLEPRFVGGMRVTDEAAISLVDRVLTGMINPSLVIGIENFGGAAQRGSGKEVFIGEKAPGETPEGEKIDLGYVGRVADVRIDAIEDAIAREVVPVVTPLAAERRTGDTLNVNADVAAAALAGRLKAQKIIFLSDVLGVMRNPERPSSLISSIADDEIEPLIEQQLISGGMIPKVRSAIDALDAGVGKVHLIDGRIPHSLLLEIFTDLGIGTEIYARAGAARG